jgi:hypothetical protein
VLPHCDGHPEPGQVCRQSRQVAFRANWRTTDVPGTSAHIRQRHVGSSEPGRWVPDKLPKEFHSLCSSLRPESRLVSALNGAAYVILTSRLADCVERYTILVHIFFGGLP